MAHSAKGKILVGMSSADYIRTSDNKEHATGFFLKELGRPLIKLLEAGYNVEFANPQGNAPALDPLSDTKMWFPLSLGAEKDREKQLLERLGVENNFKNPRRFADITDQELGRYAGVFLPGGHAPMTDLWNDKDLGRILLHFHNQAKPTGIICHAPVALLSTTLVQPKPWPYAGYQMTCYSNAEEKLNEVLWRSSLQFKAEDALRNSGAIMKEALPMMPNVVEDRELITGQGPTSADRLGEALVAALDKSLGAQAQAGA
jgi:putative intracellular protease/amidase